MADVWEKGTPLSEAIGVFARENAKTHLTAMKLAFEHPTKALELAKSINDEALVAAITKHQTLSEKYKNYLPMQALQAVGAIASKSGGSRVLEDDVLAQVQQKELIGYGYVLPRKVGDRPMQIPHDVWLGNIDWGSNSVSGNGLGFVSVRLVAVEKCTDVYENTKIRKRVAGRKSRKEEILLAYDALRSAGVLDRDTPTAILGHEIRSYILNDIPKEERRETGLSDETIRRTIRSSK